MGCISNRNYFSFLKTESSRQTSSKGLDIIQHSNLREVTIQPEGIKSIPQIPTKPIELTPDRVMNVNPLTISYEEK